MHDIRESTKLDWGVKPQLGATSINGEYFRMTTFAKGIFTIGVRGQHDGDDVTVAVYEAVDALGSGTPQQVGATMTMAQGIKVTMAQIAVDSGNSTINDTIIITPHTLVHGVLTAGTALTFTAKTTESLANRQFDQSGTADEEATSIAACINDATYGVPGLLATVTTDTVLLTLDEPGDGAFTYVESNTSAHVATDLLQQADFEVAVQDMDRADGFTHIQCRIASIETDVYTAAHLCRSLPGYQPVGQVSAYFDDAS